MGDRRSSKSLQNIPSIVNNNRRPPARIFLNPLLYGDLYVNKSGAVAHKKRTGHRSRRVWVNMRPSGERRERLALTQQARPAEAQDERYSQPPRQAAAKAPAIAPPASRGAFRLYAGLRKWKIPQARLPFFPFSTQCSRPVFIRSMYAWLTPAARHSACLWSSSWRTRL